MSLSAAADAVIQMLRAAVPPLIRPEQIGLCLPSDEGDKFLLGVFVYSVTRDPRAPMNSPLRIDASSSVGAPLLVELRVAVTAYTGKKSSLSDDYKLLERVLQVWHDNTELPLTTPLQPAHVAAPRLSLLNLDPDEISKIWQFGHVPYRLSLFYAIAPVAIPSLTAIRVSPVVMVDYAGGDTR